MTVNINPAAAVATNAQYFGDDLVLRYEGGDLTYAELDDRAARLATVLAEGGLGTGDRVAYVGLNSSSFVLTMLAAFRLGAIYVPVNFRLAGPELQAVLERSGAIAVVAEEGHRELIDHVAGQTALRRFLLVDDDPSVPAPAEHDGWEGTSGLIAAAEPMATVIDRGFDDPAALLFTSGTTGLPKGVVLTHGNIWWNSVNVDTRLDARRGDVTYAGAPLFHIGALNSFALRMIVRGGTVVVARTFDPERFLADLVEFKVNTMFVVPAMLNAVAHVPHVFETDFSALRSVVVAGAPVPPALIAEFAAHDVLLQQAWGLTETAPFATHLPAEMTLTKVGSAGIPMPYTEVRVIDAATEEEAEPGVPGEVIVRGPNVTPGYWNNPEATAAAFDEAGWFHSGDIGYLDTDGYLYIVDRLKDMIISGGENVYPAEVERVLSAMPGVADVAVIGTADAQWGETVVAVVALTPDADELTLEHVREFAASGLARYKLPRRLSIVPAVPRNASGKLDKVAIRGLVS
ncbi:AMP-binding protein [Nocardioides sp.]|uniref:AMP-binding protein n=1 Tax=Nocardioides sp. TaxID=35761 RepID=UPI00263137CE|nr:AMP-binding protein [Nocardioides sp.]